MTRVRSSGAILIVAGMALSGCVSVSPIEQSPSPSVSGRSTPEVTATAEAEDPSDPATWIVSKRGIGPFLLGADLVRVRAAVPKLTDMSENCPNPQATFLGSPRLNLAIMTNGSGAIVGVSASGASPQSDDGEAVAPDAPPAGPHTPGGIGMGSPTSDILKEFPSAVRSGYFPDKEKPFFVVTMDNGNWLSFGTYDPTTFVNTIDVWPGTLPPYEYCG